MSSFQYDYNYHTDKKEVHVLEQVMREERNSPFKQHEPLALEV